MSQILSIAMISMNTVLFSMMSHPMSMGLTLLMQTLLMCVLIGLMSYTSWLSYILFLVFLGGMLVLFIYMTSIASNELFNKTMFMPMMGLMAVITMLMLLMMVDPFMTNSFIVEKNNDIVNMTMAPLYNDPSSLITVFMVLYLFLTLVVIVSITNFQKGPLRPMN